MKKILFTTPVLEYPAAGGPQLRVENTAKALSAISDLHIICRAPFYQIGKQNTLKFYQSFSTHFVFSPLGKISSYRFLRKIQRCFSSIKKEANYIINYAQKEKINIIWLGYGNISFPLIQELRRIAPHLKLVCDTDSVWSRFVLRQLPFIHDKKTKIKIEKEGRQKIEEEKEWVNLCDITTAVSQIDADYYQSLAQNPNRIKLFSNVIDYSNYQNTLQTQRQFKRPAIFLAGTFGHPESAMNQATNWVLKKVFPLVLKAIPACHFYIVGNHSDKSFGHCSSQNITVTGKLDSVLPYLKQSDVAITPLKFESGTRFKILEAGACGVPMVSTTLGAEGLAVRHEKEVLIADTEEDFANSIIKLIQDKNFALELAKNCQHLVKEKYSLDTLTKEAKMILQALYD